MSEAANEAIHEADRLLDLIKWVSSGWLGVVSLLFIAVGLLGWREYVLIRKGREEANQAAATARESEKEVTLVAQRLHAIDESVRQGIEQFAAYFESLPNIERLGIVGEESELPSPEDILKLEEADATIVIAEKMKAVAPERLVLPLVKLGEYWRLTSNYSTAIARFKKAMEIDPKCSDAHLGLCRTLYTMAASQKGIGPRYKSRLLEDAEQVCKQLISIQGEHELTLFALAWICDERGDLEGAVGFCRQAQVRDSAMRYPNITYNLACSLSKLGRYGEALDELSKVMSRDQNWEDVQRDPDFESLRNDQEHSARFARLVAEASAEPRAS